MHNYWICWHATDIAATQVFELNNLCSPHSQTLVTQVEKTRSHQQTVPLRAVKAVVVIIYYPDCHRDRGGNFVSNKLVCRYVRECFIDESVGPTKDDPNNK